jgi:hypothetical protein
MSVGNIEVKNAHTKSQKYLAAETVRLAHEWGVDGDGIVQVTDRRNSCAWTNPATLTWEITYGRRDIEDTRKWGVFEYKTVEHMLLQRKLPVQVGRYPLLEGREDLEQCSLDILAAHEMAHVLQYRIHQNKRIWTGRRWENTIKPHGPEWREIYAHLLDCVVDKWDPEYLITQHFGGYKLAYSRSRG